MMKNLTLRNFILLILIVIIIHQVISRTSVPIMMPMEYIDTISYAIPQKDVPSHINMNFSSPKAIIPDITDSVPPQAPIPQPNYSPLKRYAFGFIYAVALGTIATYTLEPNTPFLPIITSACLGGLVGTGISVGLKWLFFS